MSPALSTTLRARVEELFEDHLDAVFNVAYRVVWSRDDAEDIVQATFLKAATRLGQLRADDRVRPWLLQIAYREGLGVLRGRRDVPTDPADLPEIASSETGPADRVLAAELVSILEEAFLQMRADERSAVVLRDIERLPMAEVARVLDIGQSAAKMRVHRGRLALRELVANNGIKVGP